MSDKIRSYTELRALIRVSLRIQNPEWVEPNGDSPLCDSYEARFAELLLKTTRPTRSPQKSRQSRSDEPIVG
jgi:hypothetical protein